MLDAYVIEEIKRRDRDRTVEERPRPVVELPVPSAPERAPERRPDDDDAPGDRGVVIIDYSG